MQNTFRTCRRTAQTEYANGGTGSAISDALIERLPDREELGNARPAPHSRRLRQRWDTEFSKHSNRTSNREPRGKATASHKSLASAATATHTSGAHTAVPSWTCCCLTTGARLGVEFKFTDRPATTKSMRVVQQDLMLDHLYVVHPGEHTFALDTAITAVTLPQLTAILLATN